MKALKSIFTVLSCLIFVISCSEDNTMKLSLATPISRTDSIKKLNTFHSEGLDFVYNQLVTATSRSTIHPPINNDTIKQLIITFSKSKSTKFNIKSFAQNFKSTRSSNEEITETRFKLSKEAENIFDHYFEELTASKSYEDAENIITLIINSNNFKELPLEQADMVTLMMYVGLDSANYWGNPINENKWEALKEGKVLTTRSMTGPPANYWTRRPNQAKLNKILKADCLGCIGSLFTGFSTLGWAAGGIFGSAICEI